ncbi:PilZ domain-containing protein [Azospira restricta]|uniref:PilZ domain-containing protein n=1 Tax=Azospira restricta TaxID=404405 RepID=A0A974SRA8_9RHOO|nr:PilZ domain-containing protein [Azospira restricta]QRJ64952.1 PilZ domain-containing protein [Azospira restricta]
MQEKRRHQRISFDDPQPIRLGHRGERAVGELENLSLGGLMFRTTLTLAVGETVGCEFRVFESPLIDLPAVVVSRIGDGLYGARFQAGPMSQHLIEDAINGAIGKGKATILSIHSLPGGKVLRVAGALTATARNDFMHGVERVGVAEIDLSGVTLIDSDGVSMCADAVARYGVRAERRSPCVEAVWRP